MLSSRRISSFAVLLLSLSSAALATEVDNFTQRSEVVDAREELDGRMNAVLDETARESTSCDVFKLHRAFYEKLGGSLYAKIELWSKDSKLVHRLPIGKSIYAKLAKRYVSKFGILPVKLEKFYTEGRWRVGDTVFGDDKLGHFFQLGYDMFYWVRSRGSAAFQDVQGLPEKYGDWRFGIRSFVNSSKLTGDELALAISKHSEEGQWGWTGPGVKSYGDMSADWEGYRFWSSLAEGEKPYFACKGGKFAKVRAFEWAEYVSPAWDEAVNCSERKPEIAKAVSEALGAKKACPVEPGACRALVARFGVHAQTLLHPLCLAAGGAS